MRTNSSKKLNIGQTKEYLQDWSMVKAIKYGMIITKDKRYLTILEVNPINYHLRSAKEQNEIIEQFAKWFKLAPSKIQFLVSSDTRNANSLIHNIKKNTENETNESVLDLQEDYIENSIKNLSSRETISKTFYIVMQYERNLDGSVSRDEMEIARALLELRVASKEQFRQFGCIVVEHEDENYFLGTCIYRELNPASSRKEELSERITRINRDQCAVQKTLQPVVDVNDYLVPRNLDDSNPHVVFIDGVYQSVVYIKGKTLPYRVYGGWFDIITSCGKGYTTSVTIEKLNKDTVIDQASRSARLNTATLHSTGNPDKVEDMQHDISNNSYIYKTLKNTDDEIYNVCIMIKMTSETYEGIERMQKELIKRLKEDDIAFGDCYTRETDALKMTLPLLYISRPIFEKSKRNFLTSSLASIFPFTSFELYSDKGIVFGINTTNNSLTVVDIFDTSRFLNANIALFGTSGAGKSFTEQTLGYGFRLSGYKVFYILPTKGHEYRRGCKAINGSYIKISPGSKVCLNPLGILPENDVDERLIEGDDYVRASYLGKKITEFKAFTQLLLRNEQMTLVEETRFDIILSELYHKFGITEDNNSIYEDAEQKRLKKMPVISDLYEMLLKEPELKKVAVCFEIFIKGSWKNLNAQTNIDLSNKYIVFDVDDNEINKNLHPAFLLLATLTAYSYIKQSRTEKCILFLDEVWKMMINEASAELVFDIVKIIRGYGGSVILCTQEINDYFGFMDGKYGKAILGNTKIKLLLYMEETDLEAVAEALKLNEQEEKLIRHFTKGQGLMIANKDNIPIRIMATQKQEELFTTDVNRLQQIAKRKRERGEQ